ncbi:MAG: aldo/keto reductase [Lachnospiraceae bacterium]|nr:aldo/keto reductase [Lachnospiraceae bacterium]
MERVKLSENLSLSRIVQGFWRLDGWDMSTDELVIFMNECIDRGVTSFDTAEIYGGTVCEKLMGDAFSKDKSIRRKIELISKTGIYIEKINGNDFGYYNTTYDRVIQSCKESLQRLQTESIDLYLIHREDPLINPWETGKALLKLKKEGLIKEIGVSNFDPYKFEALNNATDGQLVTNQIEWNPVCFEHFNSGMMDYLTGRNIHPMIWSPLAGGNLFKGTEEIYVKSRKKIEEIAERHHTDPATIVYTWIMYHPVGAMPLVGSQKLSRLDLAIKALDIKLEQHEWFEIYSASGQQQIR